jgi:hypothetical protein
MNPLRGASTGLRMLTNSIVSLNIPVARRGIGRFRDILGGADQHPSHLWDRVMKPGADLVNSRSVRPAAWPSSLNSTRIFGAKYPTMAGS